MKRTHTFRYLGLAIISAVMIAPFLWMIVTSLQAPESLVRFPPQLIPSSPKFSNYGEAFRTMPVGTFFFNSVKISLLGTVGELVAASLAAFAFARMEFRGKRIIFGALLATMMIPFQVTMIPVYVVIHSLGWLDNHASLIVPHFFGGAFASGAFGVFLLRQFFESVPKELEDASRIDGASRFRFFATILLPLSKPALGVLSLFVFMGIWNDLLTPVLFLSSEEKMPLTYGLAILSTVQHNFRYDLLMAGTLIAIVPIVVCYIFAQRYVTEAFLRTGVKG